MTGAPDQDLPGFQNLEGLKPVKTRLLMYQAFRQNDTSARPIQAANQRFAENPGAYL
ncbi:Uncharacterised protein [Candidatus Venteria ishoeyi]|uniref:Uncharacterized protein n=1 Tax=Candidatus Venteria ishoeyi TaxID=1899563 RepID=A0A1H6F4B7_9GAMM|nr:Uncharacterised protein [Candidatus Venteria ishoeyi]